MPTEAHIAQFILKVDGSPVPTAVMDALLDCVIDNSLHLPDVCVIRMHDGGFHWLDAEIFTEGKSVEVTGGMESSALLPLFYGEITALEMDMAGQNSVPTLIVRCYDRSHRLHRGRQCRSFVQMTDSDIVQKVGAEAGFTVHADSTSEVHEWILQNNQTNWEFLTERAGRNGYRLYVEKETDLYFTKVKNEGDSTVTLEWGLELRSFRPRVSASPQVNEVVVRGWDPKTKNAIVGRSQSAQGVPQVNGPNDGGDVGRKAFGAAKMVVTDRPVFTQGEADDLARSVCDSMGGEFLEADGLCYGHPDIKPGVQVEIKNIGKRFSGAYLVTATTHTYTTSEGFSSLFSVNAKEAPTLLGMLRGNDPSRRMQLGGNIVVGVVTANNDPDGMGRVQVVYPWLTEEHTSFWARTVSQMAGSGRGMFNLPEIGDEVLLAFEHGDIRRPYVLGQLWNGKDPLPTVTGNNPGNPVLGPSNEVNRRGFYSRIGHQLNFDDTDGKGDITLRTANNHVLTLDDANQKVQITTTGNHVLVMDDANQKVQITTTGGHVLVMDDKNQVVTIQTTGKHIFTMDDQNAVITAKTTAGHMITMDDNGAHIVVQDPSGDMIEIQDAGIININANQSINLSAMEINISAEVALNMSGTTVGVSGDATVSISGGAEVDISAAMVMINS